MNPDVTITRWAVENEDEEMVAGEFDNRSAAEWTAKSLHGILVQRTYTHTETEVVADYRTYQGRP